MLRYKQFTGNGRELERIINHWLAEYEPNVTHMTQSASSDGLTISFLYDESFRGQELRFSEEHGVVHPTMPPVPSEDIPSEPLKVPEVPGEITPEVHPDYPPTLPLPGRDR